MSFCSSCHVFNSCHFGRGGPRDSPCHSTVRSADCRSQNCGRRSSYQGQVFLLANSGPCSSPRILDPNKECEPYFHPPIVNALASFPPIWQSATILPGDTNAQAKWDSIKANVPNISPKVSKICRDDPFDSHSSGYFARELRQRKLRNRRPRLLVDSFEMCNT